MSFEQYGDLNKKTGGLNKRRYQETNMEILGCGFLVGGIPTPLKNMKVNWDDYSQCMEKKCSKPPTSVVFDWWFYCSDCL